MAFKSLNTEDCFDTEVACNQLRGLWTAYCLRYGLVADTLKYDNDLLAVWERVAVAGSDTAFWSDYDSLDCFMCAYLVYGGLDMKNSPS